MSQEKLKSSLVFNEEALPGALEGAPTDNTESAAEAAAEEAALWKRRRS